MEFQATITARISFAFHSLSALVRLYTSRENE
jgi:hypothetical protein